MPEFERPTKEVVRAWLKREVEQRRPPPDINQIRRELGWNLVQCWRNCGTDQENPK